MKQHIIKLLNFPIIFLLLASFFLFSGSSLAQQSPLNLTFSPNRVDLKTGDEKIIKLTLASENGISAFDLKFQTSGSLTVTDFRDVIDTNTNLNPFEYKQIKENINGSNSQLSFIFNVPAQKLPKLITIYLKVKGTTTGEGKITVDYNSSQALSSNGTLLQINPNQSATFNLNLTQSSPEFIDQTSFPPVNYPPSTAVVNMKLNLYGAKPTAGTKIKATAVAVGRVGDSKYETLPQEFNLTAESGSRFTGSVAFPDFKDGNKFSLMIKVDKYLLKRICNTNASETKPQGYSCKEPDITIRRGENNSFDFTKVPLLPGDLGLIDGVLNGYDLSLVRNNLGRNTEDSAGTADLNYDGLVDQKDFDIISFIAGNTSRKGDQ